MRCKSGNSPSCTGRPRGPAKAEPPSATLKSQYFILLYLRRRRIRRNDSFSRLKRRSAETTTGTQREVERGHTGHMHYMLKKHTHVSAYSFVRILNKSRSVFLSHSGVPFIIPWIQTNRHRSHTPPTPHPHLISSSPLPRADARTACPRHHTKRPHPRPKPPGIIQLGLRAR